MNIRNVRVLVIVLLTVGFMNVDAKPLIPPCEVPFGSSCRSTHEAIIYPGNVGPQEYCPQVAGFFCVDKALKAIPAPAWVHCQSKSPYSVICSAWPRGDLQYNWATSGGISMPGGPAGHSVEVSCNQPHGNGLISVQLVSTQGMYETVFFGVQCGTVEY